MFKACTHLRFFFLAAFLLLGVYQSNAQASITVNGSTTICPGDSVILTASQGDSYQWLNFGFPIFGATEQNYAAKQTGQYTVVVTISLIPYVSATTAITVSPVPTVFINAGNQVVCPGTPVSITLTGSNNSALAASLNAFLPTNAHVAIPHQSQLNSNTLTVEVWARPQQNLTPAGIVSKLPISTSFETGYAFRQVGNRFQFCIGKEGSEIIAQSNTFNLGPWYHLTGTYDGSTVKIYVNGILHSSTPATGSINSTTDIIVGNNVSLTAPFKGLMDELRIWNYAANASDIQCNYRVSANPTATGLVGYWPMNDATNNTTPDITAYNNDGNVQNGTSLVSSGAGLTHMFTWDAAPGITNTSATCFTFIPTSTHIYRVVSQSNAGCLSQDTAMITVLPVAQVYNVTGGGIYCTGNPGLPIGLSNSETGVTYQLKLNNANFGAPVAGTGGPLTLAAVTQAGTYTVTATLGTCSNEMSGSATVQVFSSPEIITWVITNAVCNGGTGAIDVTVHAGNPPFTYSWSTSETTEDVSNKPAGTYGFEVSDTKGCHAIKSFDITEPTPALVSGTHTNVVCNGQNNGTISLVTGGTAPHTFAWSINATTQNLANLAPGTYNVTVTDALNCSKTASYTVTEPAALSVIGAINNVTCNGLDNGAINATVTGGTAPYTYSWSNNATSQDLASLQAGTYTLTVTDANGCTSVTSYTVTEPQLLGATAAATNVTCFNANNGSINLTITGGTAPFAYSWSNSAATEDLSNLAPGIYTVTVTDANACVIVASATITQPASALAVSGTVTNVNCFAQANGSVDLSVTGGTAPYSYNWSNSATSQDLNNILAGSYSITVTDASGCSVTTSFTITEPSPFVITKNITHVTCAGGSNGAIDITATGGAGPFSYNWSNSATTEDISNLAAGNYTITVSYAGGCSYSETIAVNQPTAITAVATATGATCSGNNTNGTASLSVIGGTAPYTFVWSNNATTQNISSLAPGNYSVVITDANGCTATAAANVAAPAPVVLAGTTSNNLCFGNSNGAIDLAVNSGTAPFTYLWSNNATTQDLTGLAAGNYSVTVTDNNGCTSTASFTITAPTAINATVVSSNVSCNGANNGTIDLTVTGGSTPYSYSWSNNATTQDLANLAPGSYSVTITDEGGCIATASASIAEPAAITVAAAVTNVNCNGQNTGAVDITVTGGTAPYTYAWSNTAATQDITGLGAGNYSVAITDANGCTKAASFSITQPAVLTVTGVVTNVTTNGSNNGNINITVAGGTAPYSYLWSNNSTNEDANGLVAGNYSVTVTDANGCTASASYTVTQPAGFTVNGNVVNATCGNNNGSITLSIVGGTAPFTYNWGNNITTQNRTNLAPGNYTVSVKDATNVIVTKSFTVGSSPMLNVGGTTTPVTCFGTNNGAIDATVTGGTAPYNYYWLLSNANTEDRTNLYAGIYYLYVTDANGCADGKLFIVGTPAPIIAYGSKTNITCYGANTGSIDLSVYGGTAPYTYSWSNNATTQDIANLSAGTYTVTITDANGCIETQSFTITQPSSGMNVTAVVTSNCNSNSGSINQTVTGGSSPYTYQWSNSSYTGQDRTNLAAGTYTCTITDDNGCSIVKTYTIAQPSNNIVVTASVTNVSCNNGNNGAISLSTSGGAAPYSYDWSNSNSTSANRTGLSAGTYTVEVTDNNGCEKTVSFTVTQPSAIAANIAVNPSPTVTNGQANTIYLGYGAQSVTLTGSATGGTAPYTYYWSGTGIGGNTNASVSVNPTSTKTYTLTITDSKGCTKTVTKTIKVIDVRSGNNKIKVCHNGNTLSVSSSAVQAHLNHGDQLGNCDDNDDDDDDCDDKQSPVAEHDDHHDEETQSTGTVSALVVKAISIYPNPSDGVFTVQLPAGDNNAQVVITDMTGKLVEKRVVTGSNTVIFEMGHIAKGSYNIHVNIGTEVYSSRVILK